MGASIIAVIKPTKKNLKTLKERGLHSDDSEYTFKVYNALIGGSNVILSYRQDDVFGR